MINFENKQITIMGLGLHGGSEGLIKYLDSKGAKITVTDLKKEKELFPTIQKLKDLPIKYHLGGHSWEDFKSADIIFVNQAVPKKSLWYQKILKSGIPINTETNLFFSLCPTPIIGVTGTNGKSTVATLIYQILEKGLKDKNKVFFGGNIGGSLLPLVEKIKPTDLVVMELSSFQLQDLGQIQKSPHIAVVLNISPDHLDYHKNLEEYIEAKKNIVKYQQESDFAILNYDDQIVKNFSQEAKSRILFFSIQNELKSGSFISGDKIMIAFRGTTEEIIPIKKIKLPGEHNLSNVLAAVSCTILYRIKSSQLALVIKNFSGLPHRIEFIKEINGIKYYNDSKATTPESTIMALKSFSSPIILIAGGSEKEANFRKLSQLILEKTKAVLLIGTTAKKIEKSILKQSEGKKLPDIILAGDLARAIKLARNIAVPGDVVLLSPACASYDQFRDFEERGEKFKSYLEKY